MLVILKLLSYNLLVSFFPRWKSLPVQLSFTQNPFHAFDQTSCLPLALCKLMVCFCRQVLWNCQYGANALHIDERNCDVFPLLFFPFPNNLEHSIPFSDLYRAPCSSFHGAACILMPVSQLAQNLPLLDLGLHLCMIYHFSMMNFFCSFFPHSLSVAELWCWCSQLYPIVDIPGFSAACVTPCATHPVWHSVMCDVTSLPVPASSGESAYPVSVLSSQSASICALDSSHQVAKLEN